MITDRKILAGDVCPYCGRASNSSGITQQYKVCDPCGAYIKVKDGKAAGRLANKELRQLKLNCYELVNKAEKEREIPRVLLFNLARKHMKITPALFNLNYFDVEECQQFINIINDYLKTQKQ